MHKNSLNICLKMAFSTYVDVIYDTVITYNGGGTYMG